MVRLARFCFRRRRLVTVAWLVFALGLVSVAGMLKPDFDAEYSLSDADSQHAYETLEKHFPERSKGVGEIVFHAPAGMNDPGVRAETEHVIAAARAIRPAVAEVISPYDPRQRHSMSRDGRTAIAQIRFTTLRTEVPDETRDAFRDLAGPQGRVRAELAGTMFAPAPETGMSETTGLVAAVVVLLAAFGGLLIAGMPILIAVLGLFTAMGLVMVLAKVMEVPDFTLSVAAMIVLGVGVDYALFIVARYRAALRSGLEPEEAVATAIATAGRAVLFAGVIVVVSLCGMLFMGVGFVHGLAIGCALGVLATLVLSITLLPALLGFAGRSIDRFRVRRVPDPHHAPGWSRWRELLSRRAGLVVLAGAAVLLVLSLPVLSMRLGSTDASDYPASETTRRAYDLKTAAFGPGSTATLLLVVSAPDGLDRAALDRLAQRVRATGVAQVTPPQPSRDGKAAVITVIPRTHAQDPATPRLVADLRSEVIPASGVTAHVGGVTATFEDLADRMESRLPAFVIAVLGLSFLLLVIVFRSVVVPFMAVALTLLSLTAAYGVLVAVFQGGWGKSLFGIGSTGPLESYTPMTLMALLFGLSMDYQVFLLSRLKEARVRGVDAREALGEALRASGRVILAAALIMAAVFGAFTLSGDRIMKQFGLGLAVAILVEAAVVLSLVPAILQLLGRHAWWQPRWLRRLPELRVEGHEPAARPRERSRAG